MLWMRSWNVKAQPRENYQGKNGNNGVWMGSTKAGVRLYLKGDDPLWQAGVPFDSIVSPEPPQSWSNHGLGGVEVRGDGQIVAFSGESCWR